MYQVTDSFVFPCRLVALPNKTLEIIAWISYLYPILFLVSHHPLLACFFFAFRYSAKFFETTSQSPKWFSSPDSAHICFHRPSLGQPHCLLCVKDDFFHRSMNYAIIGWWFGTFLFFHSVRKKMPTDSNIFQGGLYTTNHTILGLCCLQFKIWTRQYDHNSGGSRAPHIPNISGWTRITLPMKITNSKMG